MLSMLQNEETIRHAARVPAGDFSNNPLIYHVLVDRFLDTDPQRTFPFGRERGNASAPGAFQGGTFAGVTAKLKEGWFARLGINALLISPPYEQIHGWVPGGNKEFRHYGYHGYYALDFTLTDPNFGSREDLRELIDCAHAQGIRVLFDVVLNHPGYADARSLADLGIDVLAPGWEGAGLHDYHDYIDYNSSRFARWWGASWVRCGLPGYPAAGADELTMQLADLPDFRTECPQSATPPEFFGRKAGTRVRTLIGASVRGYLVDWLTTWVRELGVDGFRCDSVRHVEPEAWASLKSAALDALADWKRAHPEKKIDDAPFWMMGEVFGHGTERSDYFEHGFDSVLNFQLQHEVGQHAWVDHIYARYCADLTAGEHQFVSYISSHDTHLFPRHELARAATALMLAPGAVMLFYGDESARPAWPAPAGDLEQGTRSTMNWDKVDPDLLAHWRKLGQFRRRHPALARGAHRQVSDFPYAFTRDDAATGDLVMVVLEVMAGARLAVPACFKDASQLYDAYGDRWLAVIDGCITFSEYSALALVELTGKNNAFALTR